MNIGDSVTCFFDDKKSELCVASIGNETIKGIEYVVYNISSGHILYVKKSAFVDFKHIDVKNHISQFSNSIKTEDDYTILINWEYILPIC